MSNETASLKHVLEIINTVKNNTLKDVLHIKTTKEKTSLYDSKFGGVPYLPKCGEIPINDEGKQLKLLAQINFENVPENNILPKGGILQFYVYPDDCYGIDFDEPTNQNNFKVIYHEKIDFSVKEEVVISKIHDCELDEDDFPIEGEYKLEFKCSKEGISLGDYNFNKIFIDEYNKQFPKGEIEDLYDLDEDIYEELFEDEDEDNHHKIGGYPFFTQSDPREFEENLNKFDTLLLQINSEEDDENGIMWGDCGVCNFFINSEDLKNKDFSKVLYNWDCY